MSPLQQLVYEQTRPSIQLLREHGFAVVIFNPEELDGIDRYRVESDLVEEGWKIIEYWTDLRKEQEGA